VYTFMSGHSTGIDGCCIRAAGLLGKVDTEALEAVARGI
jgi:hypothetical protein